MTGITENHSFSWNAGIYARLSVDGPDRKNESIETQLEIAKNYIRQSGDIQYTDSYIDLGKTGTDFRREGFSRLMADIRRHKINCVVVKDFSRFGRNYIETGNYIEKIFPFFNIRFISVSDEYDSHRLEGENDFLTVNLKNIVNELYARDCAEKVRAVKEARLKQGCYIGGTPPYGYFGKYTDGKKVLFPETGTSDVVRKIYELFDEGYSITKIISYLYERGVHRPKDYRSTGEVYCKDREQLRQWSDATIRSMLSNHIYIGALVQIKADGKKLYKRGSCLIEPDETLMTEHAHEPLVSEARFYRISAKLQEKRKKKHLRQDSPPEDLYKDLLYCGECGHKLKRFCSVYERSYQVAVRSYSYGCPYTGRIDGLNCSNHYISQNATNKIVCEALKKEFALSGVPAASLIEFNQKQAEEAERRLDKKEKMIKSHIHGIDGEMSALYLQYRSGRIDQEMFLDKKKEREGRKTELIRSLSEQQQIQSIERKAEEMDHLIHCLWKGKENAVLDGRVLRCLIKKITVWKDKRVEIIFNFSRDQFESCKRGT